MEKVKTHIKSHANIFFDKSSNPLFAFVIQVNVFRGIFKNPLFCAVLVMTAAAQVVIVEFGGNAMHVYLGGLSGKYWGISIAFGVGSLIMQQVINVAYWLGKKLV